MRFHNFFNLIIVLNDVLLTNTRYTVIFMDKLNVNDATHILGSHGKINI